MKRFPPIPKKVRGAGGPIKVIQVKRIKQDGDDCWGQWEEGKRLIRLEKGAPPRHKWRTFFHELTHAAIHDAGIGNLLSNDGIETLCDAMATARIQEMCGELGLPG